MQDPVERQLLTQAFVEGSIALEGIVDTLTPEAGAVYRLLSRPDLDQVDQLMTQLSPETIESLRLISPSTGIADLKARVLIMHDRADSLVPSEESLRLAEAVEGRNSTYYTEFSFFQHVDPTRSVSPPVYLREGFKLFLHMYNIMRELS